MTVDRWRLLKKDIEDGRVVVVTIPEVRILLAELEQAEARLAKVRALVEALKEAQKWIDRGERFGRQAAEQAREALAAWEQE